MLKSLSARVVECLQRADDARQRALASSSDCDRDDFLEIEFRWRHLAESFQHSERVEDFLRLLPKAEIRKEAVFDPETLASMARAYERVLKELHDKGQPAIVREAIARSIVDLAQRGERDSERLFQLVSPRLLGNRTMP